MDKSEVQLNTAQIVRAFEAIINPNNTKQLIKSADEYLNKCQSNPNFSLALIQLFTQCQHLQTQFQILIHLKNVIKRNWNTKRRTGNGCIIPHAVKQEIKDKLVQMYRVYWKKFYKEFNQIFKYLARQDFPNNYDSLNLFVHQVLTNVAQYQLDQVLSAEQLLPYLSLVKVVYKFYAQRRMLHTAQSFKKYCSPTLEYSKMILGKINEAFQVVRNKGQNMQVSVANKLFECSRKVDKIVLYCIQSMVSSLQYDQEIVEIIGFQVKKVTNLVSLMSQNWRQQIEKNIHAIIQQLARLQSFFPLLFTPYLSDYLSLITQLIFSPSFHSFTYQKLQKSLLHSNKVPHTCFLYYMTKQQFKQSLQYKKDNQLLHQNSQQKCHQIYISFYGNKNMIKYLQKLCIEVMSKFRRENEDDQILFEDAEGGAGAGEGIGDMGMYEVIVDLVHTIMSRFKVQASQFVESAIGYLVGNQQDKDERVVRSMLQVILLLPRALERMKFNMGYVMQIMQMCYAKQDYDMFCRFVRNYHQYFQDDIILNSFQILTQIASNPQSSPHTVYQSSICLRKLILQHDQLSLPLHKIYPCITRIFSLIRQYKQTPTHLWNLLNLLIQIIKTLSIENIYQNLEYMVQCIEGLLDGEDNDHVVLCAVVELLQCLLMIVEKQGQLFWEPNVRLVGVSVKLILLEPNQDQQQHMAEVHKDQLWLCAIKNIHSSYCPQPLKQTLQSLLLSRKPQTFPTNPSLYLQILQQYMLANLVTLSSTDLLHLYEQISSLQPSQQLTAAQAEAQTLTLTAFFSLTYTYFLINGFKIDENSGKLLIIGVAKIAALYCKVSQMANGLRMFIMLQVCSMVLSIGAQTVFGAFNQVYPDYRQWFLPFMTGLQYVNNRYASKVVAIAMIQSTRVLTPILLTDINGDLPFDPLLRQSTPNLQPLTHEQALSSYQNSLKLFSHTDQIRTKIKCGSSTNKHCRKILLHVNSTLAQLDLRPVYKENIGELFRLWDWGVDDLQERYSDGLVQKVVGLLGMK